MVLRRRDCLFTYRSAGMLFDLERRRRMHDRDGGLSGRLRLALCLLIAIAGVLIFPARASAQAGFPNRPVTIVVPYAAGGVADTLARAIARALAERWGQPVVVDNRAGGGTVIGTALVARAPGDGYTLLLTSF